MKDKKPLRGWLPLTLLLITALACSPLSLLPDLGPDGGSIEEVQVNQIRLSILESFPVQVQLTIAGLLPNPCFAISSVESQRVENTFEVQVRTEQTIGDCGGGPVSFQEQVPLDVYGLPAGEYQVVVDGVSQSFTLQTDNILPTEEAPDQSRVDLGQGVSLAVPESIGATAELNPVPSQAAADDPMPFNNYPDRLEISFPNYPLGDTFHEPRIELYPLQPTVEMNAAAAETVAALRVLLEDPPSDLPDPLPFLPIFNAGPLVQAQEMVVTNENVEGVRYLTQFGQALFPVNNRDLFYTFQGVTTDGSYYVLAVLPISHPDLPATGDDFLGMEPEDFYESADSYLTETEVFLNEQPASSFLPELMTLDEVIMSLEVN